MFNDMSLHLMVLIIRYFKPNSFDAILERQANSILGTGFKRHKNLKGNTKYWISDYQSGEQADYEKNIGLNRDDIDTLEMLAKYLQD